MLDLTEEETAALARLLSRTIDDDRYPLSPRIQTLKAVLAKIRPEHFLPAYERAFTEHAQEIATIAGKTEAPDFENTVIALEKSGPALSRIDLVLTDVVMPNMAS